MNAKVNMLLMSMLLLLLLDVVVASMSTKVVSFSKAEKRGSLMCAANVPDKTLPSSSLKDCSLNCSLDDICSGFNIKDSVTCDVYHDEPSLMVPVPGCTFYKVATIRIWILLSARMWFYVYLCFCCAQAFTCAVLFSILLPLDLFGGYHDTTDTLPTPRSNATRPRQCYFGCNSSVTVLLTNRATLWNPISQNQQ